MNNYTNKHLFLPCVLAYSACYPHTERDDEDRILYNFVEIHELENLTTLNAELYVRVFQSSVIRDITLGEVTLPLRDDTNPR